MGADFRKEVFPSTPIAPTWLINTSTTFVGIVGLVLALLYKFQDNMLYFPDIPGMQCHSPKDNPEGYRDPMESGNVPYENVMIPTSDGEKIHAWLMLQKHNAANSPTLIYFHGNAGNMGFRVPNGIEMYARCGLNILMMDYRGFGDSSGVPNEKGIEMDADAVLKFALNHPKLVGSPIILFGRSLGGAVSISLAHRNPGLIAAIVVENTFLSISAMVDVLLPWVSFAKNLVLRIGWDNEARIGDLTCAMLFISGDADELVPPPQMKKLYDLATKSSFRDFYSILGGGHNDSFLKAGVTYYRRLRDFVSRPEVMGHRKPASANIRDNEEIKHKNLGFGIPTMQSDFTVK